MSGNTPFPQDQEGWMRYVEKYLRRLDRRPGGVANATVTTDGDMVRVPTTPRYVPTAPPASAPTISVTGSSFGMTVVAIGVVDPTTVLDYYLDGVLVTSTRSVVLFWQTDSVGAPMVAGVDYTWQVYARNDLGSVASNVVTGTLDPGVSSRTVLGWVAAGFILAGQIQVGNITIDPDTGITIPLANGGTIAFPSDGSDAVITAVLRARSLVVEDKLRILGQTNSIEGGLVLAAGTVAPVVPLRASMTWADPSQHLDVDADFSYPSSGLYDNGTNWVVPFGPFGTSLAFVDKTTGDVDFGPAFGAIAHNFSALGGVTKVGSSWYVLGQDYNRGDGDWYVYIYDSSWVKTGEWRLYTWRQIGTQAAMTTDGTNLWISYYSVGAHQTRIESRTVSGGLNLYYVLSSSSIGDHRGLYVGSADFGAAKILISTPSKVYAWSNAGGASGATQARDTTHDWNPAAAEEVTGLAWDGTRFHSLSAVGKIWHYSLVASAVTRTLTGAWYDSVGTTHETQPGPSVSYSIPARTWTQVDSDPPNDTGGVDDPDSIRVYANNHRQADLGSGVTSALYDTFDLTGAAGQTVNEFASVTGQLGTLAALNGGFFVDGESDGDWPGKLTVSDTVPSGAATTTTSGGLCTLTVAPGFTPTQYECFVDNSAYRGVVDMATSNATTIKVFFRNLTVAGSPVLNTVNVGDIRWVAFP